MKKEKLEEGLFYLAEIKALKQVAEICSAYGWQKLNEHRKTICAVSVLGTDYGKPNADKLMTEIAQGNREMFFKMSELVNKRIKEIQDKFDSL